MLFFRQTKQADCTSIAALILQPSKKASAKDGLCR